MALQIDQLLIYPIKGCAGQVLETPRWDAYGLWGDRRWAVVDAQGTFISQRSHPLMCRIRVHLGQTLTVHYEGMGALELDIAPSGHPIPIQIWEDEVLADDGGDRAASWFSRVIGESVRLVGLGASYHRPIRLKDQTLEEQVHLGDAFPLLVISQASLDDLNSRLDQPVPMNRFRPNIVISGVGPYEEDKLLDLEVYGKKLLFGKKCGRCSVTTIDQETGISGKEPLRTLSEYRKEGSKVCFGSYYRLESPVEA
jgi:hypothetical protein